MSQRFEQQSARDSRRAAQPRFGRQAAVIFGVALALRAAHLWWMRSSPFFDVLAGDARSYDAWAREIAAGDWIGRGVFYQAPLYAYFLGVTYRAHGSLLVARVAQAVLGAAACALIAYATNRWFGRRAGLAAGLALAVYAPAIFAGGIVQKSALDIFLMCLLIAILSGSGNFFWAGVVLGALSLTRENALVFAPVLVAWLWLHLRSPARERAHATAWLLAGLAIVLVPVALRNRLAGGELHLTTMQSGPNFFIGNNPRASGTYMPLRSGRGSPEYERVDATELAAAAVGRPLSAGEVSSYWTGRALEYIRTQPLDWAALEMRKFRLLWNAREAIDTESQESHADYSPVLRVASRVAHFGVLAPLAALGIWITARQWRRVSILYFMMVAYAASVLAFYVVARYRLPLALLLIVFAGAALAEGLAVLRARTQMRPLRGVVAMAAVAVGCNWPALSADAMRAASYHNLGAALQSDGRLGEAATAYERALQIDPDYAPSHDGLGSVLRQRGQLDEAIRELQEAIRLSPDFVDARYNLANAFADRGSVSDAIALYEDVLQRRPGAADAASNVDVHSNLAIALTRSGRLDEAIEHFRKAALLAPRSPTTHYNLGHALFTRGDVPEAIVQLTRAVDIEPGNLSARYELANAYMARAHFEEAAEQYRETLRLSPVFAEAHNNLGIVLASLGRPEEAVEEFRQALAINPSFGAAQANMQLITRSRSRRHRK